MTHLGDEVKFFPFRNQTLTLGGDQMKKTATISLIFAVCLFVVFVLSAQAIDSIGFEGPSWFKVSPTGPISVNVDSVLKLNVNVANQDDVSQELDQLQIIVIDPLDGTRVYGPKVVSVQQVINSQGSITEKVGLGPFGAATQDRTLGAIIYAIDTSLTVRGVGGWGFVVK